MDRDQGSLAAARWQVLTAAFLFSTGGAAIKATALNNWQVASFRSMVAAAALLLLVPAARRAWTRRTALVGAAYASILVFFVTANKMTTGANAIFLQSTGPLYLVFLGPWVLQEPVKRRELGFLLLMAFGLALFFVGDQSPQATAPQPVLGNILATLSGLSWALTVTGLRWLARAGVASVASVGLGNVITAAVCLAPALATPVTGSVKDAAIIVYLGMVQIGLAYYLLTRGVRRLPALETSMLVLLEPALNPVWTWMVHGEHVPPLCIGGGIAILSATVGMVLADRFRSGK